MFRRRRRWLGSLWSVLLAEETRIAKPSLSSLFLSLCSADETSRRFGVRNFLLSKTSLSAPNSDADLKKWGLPLLWGKLIIHSPYTRPYRNNPIAVKQ